MHWVGRVRCDWLTIVKPRLLLLFASAYLSWFTALIRLHSPLFIPRAALDHDQWRAHGSLALSYFLLGTRTRAGGRNGRCGASPKHSNHGRAGAAALWADVSRANRWHRALGYRPAHPEPGECYLVEGYGMGMGSVYSCESVRIDRWVSHVPQLLVFSSNSSSAPPLPFAQGAQAAGAGVPFPAIDLDQLGRTVLVGSGAPFASEEEVRRAVAECGPVVSVRIVGPRRDFCWVEFATTGAAAAAAALDDGGILRVQPAAAARAGAEALASSLAATDPARALAMQQAQRFAALSAQQAALAESVLAARAMRAGATLPAKNAADVQKNAALAAAAALAKRLAGGAVKEDQGAARRSREPPKDRSRDRSRDGRRRRRSESRSRSPDRGRRRRSTSRSRSPDRSRRRRSSSRHRSSREGRDDDRDRRRRHHKSSSSSKHRRWSSSRDRKSIKKEAPTPPAKDELDELFDELEG